MEPAAGGKPQIDRIAQPFNIDAGTAIDRAQQRNYFVGPRPPVARHEAVEPGLDVPAANGIERPREPVAEMEPDCCTVVFVGPHRPVGVDRHIVLEGLFEDRHGARFGAIFRRIATASDIAEHPVRHTARLLGRYPAVASPGRHVCLAPSGRRRWRGS